MRGPIGLGYRVPCFVISPYSRGGLVASETFDHTSQLRLLERRFGVDVPNLTPWRRRVTGDMTSAFDFAAPPNRGRPVFTDPQPPTDRLGRRMPAQYRRRQHGQGRALPGARQRYAGPAPRLPASSQRLV